MELQFKNIKRANIYRNIYFIFISILLFMRVPINNEMGYIDSTLLYIRIVNVFLAYLALRGAYVIYNKNKNSTIFILGLMILCFSLDVTAGNIDSFLFDGEKFIFSNHISVLTSLLRITLLVVSVNPDSKIHKYIYKHGKIAVILVITYSYICELLTMLLTYRIIIKNGHSLILYNIMIIFIYLLCSIKLWNLSKRGTFILKYFSISIQILTIKAIYGIYSYFSIDFNVKLISCGITSLFFINIIIATGVKLFVTGHEYNHLNNELMKFFNFVEKNNHSNMFICDTDFNLKYINLKMEKEYKFEDVQVDFRKKLIENKSVSKRLNDISNSLSEIGYWSGIINDTKSNKIFDCYIQMLDNSGGKNQVLVSYVDISSKIELEEALENLKIREVKKDEFISNMSHELKTPINIFYSTVQLLESNCNNEDIDFRSVFMKHKNTLKLNSKRMIRLINNIIDISRIDLGTLTPHYGNYNIVLLVEDIIDSIVPFGLSKDLSIQFDTNSEEHYIKCDPLIIEKIVLNLLSNAIKYSERNTNIFVLLLVENNEVSISITDEGRGIDFKHRDTVFDRFTRLDDSFSRLNEGSGIGLSIVKSLVDVIDGKITLESEVGVGSTFKVSLPNKLIESEENKNYKYESTHNISIELSDIYEIN